jgi:GAF domain-containing protein
MFSLEPVNETKAEQYELLLKQLKALIADETDWLANLANTASVLYHSLSELNWSGFYLIKGEELVLGPFVGKPACVRIPIGKGVCGTAVAKQKTMVVEDVHQFSGHIACDADSRSEIVVPLIKDGHVFGVLDIDSPVLKRFDSLDREHLEKMVQWLVEQCNWEHVGAVH